MVHFAKLSILLTNTILNLHVRASITEFVALRKTELHKL